MNQKQALERPDDQTTHALAVEALDEIGLVRVEIDLAESPYLLAVNQARNLGELLIEAADKLGAQGAGAMSDQEREALNAAWNRCVEFPKPRAAAREDTERTCPHCGKLILAPRRSYEIDPAAVCKCGAHTGHRSTY